MPNSATQMHPFALIKCLGSDLDRDDTGLFCCLTTVAIFLCSNPFACSPWACDLLDDQHLLAKWPLLLYVLSLAGHWPYLCPFHNTYMILWSCDYLLYRVVYFSEDLLHEYLPLLMFVFVCMLFSGMFLIPSVTCFYILIFCVVITLNLFCILPGVCYPIQLGSGCLWCKFLLLHASRLAILVYFTYSLLFKLAEIIYVAHLMVQIWKKFRVALSYHEKK